MAPAKDLPPDQRRQTDRGHLQRRDHQHALHAGRRGLPRGAEMGQIHRRPGRADARANANASAVWNFCAANDWIANLAVDPATRSNTSVCLKFTDDRITDGAAFAKAVAKRLGGEHRPRYRRLPRRPCGPAHLVRRDGRDLRRRGHAALACMGV